MLDVAIVGAGASGLHAAGRLQAAGCEVQVLELRERVGGRLHAAEFRGQAIDLGATWIWPSEPLVMGLVQELGLETFEQHAEGSYVFDGPHGPQPMHVPAPPVPSLRLSGGLAGLAEQLAERLASDSLRLGAQVKRIDQGPAGGLRLGLTSGESIEAKNVLLALPPALAVASIELEPGLPKEVQELAARTPVWMGPVAKTVAVYDDPFWRAQGLSGSGMSHRGPLQEIHDMSGPEGQPAALFGFGQGSSGPSQASIEAQLVRMFGPRAQEPRAFFQQDWSREPATSPAGVASLQDYGLFGHPSLQAPYMEGRLQFCSAETGGPSGHVEDALAAANRAVQRLLA